MQFYAIPDKNLVVPALFLFGSNGKPILEQKNSSLAVLVAKSFVHNL